jgi:hypothetical protein
MFPGAQEELRGSPGFGCKGDFFRNGARRRMDMQLTGTQALPQRSSLDTFIGEFQAAVARHAGIRLTRQNELLVRAVVASVVKRASARGILPADARLIAARRPDGMAFRVLCESGPITEGFMSGPSPRLKRIGLRSGMHRRLSFASAESR